MTAPTTELKNERRSAAVDVHPLPPEIDYSCRRPLTLLITCSLIWLVVSLVFAVLASVKMHAPGMMAGVAALTYGRVAAVASSALLYGFLSQAGIAIALWLFARMGRTFLILPNGATVGGILWNLGVLGGIGGIMAGEMTHFPAYEMPPWTTPVFIVAFLILGLSGLLTFVARTERELYPSNWFIFAAFFVFPWISAVAYLLLGRYRIRPVLEPIISTWYANQFTMLWLAPIALAVNFYFISKLSAQPLYSRQLAVFSFWSYLLAATASGFQNLIAVPGWMPVLSSTINFLLAIPVIGILYNWYKTWKGHNRAKKQKDVSSKYVVFSAGALVVLEVFLLMLSYREIDKVVGLTIFTHGVSTWTLYGFIGMAFFAAIYHIAPRLTEIDWPSPRLTSVHFGLTVAGVVLVTLALLLGGYVQGAGINTPSLTFVQVARRVVMYIGMNSLGLILLLIGQIALLWNLVLMLKSCAMNCCGLGRKEIAR